MWYFSNSNSFSTFGEARCAPWWLQVIRKPVR